MKRTLCLKSPKEEGEKVRKLLVKLNLLDVSVKIERNKDHLFFPLLKKPNSQEMNKIGEIKGAEICFKTFKTPIRKPKGFIESLENEISFEKLSSLPHSFDIVGDIAIMEIPPEFSSSEKELIGNAILETHKNIHTVLAKFSKIGEANDVFRTRKFEHLAGEKKTTTVHKEFGCQYKIDLSKVYFSSRLSNEHNRVASQVKQGETIIDMFAGVGPFSILIGKKVDKVVIYSIDINSDAISCLKENVLINKVEKQVIPIHGDVRKIIPDSLAGLANRVIMDLPKSSIEFVDVACLAIKPEGGVIHYYCFSQEPSPEEKAIREITSTVEFFGRNVVKVLECRKVKTVAPFTYQIVVDTLIE